jgi:hypothetical protein
MALVNLDDLILDPGFPRRGFLQRVASRHHPGRIRTGHEAEDVIHEAPVEVADGQVPTSCAGSQSVPSGLTNARPVSTGIMSLYDINLF